MAKHAKADDLPLPGPLRIRESVRVALYSLRHLTQTTLDALTPPRTLPLAKLERTLILSVEEALRCKLPDEILACLANEDDELVESGFEIGSVYEHTRRARKRGLTKDLVAVGRQPDSHAYYCISRQGERDRGVQIADFDNFDGSVNWYDLGDWLSKIAERRREFLSEDYPSVTQWQPSSDELSAFMPAIVE